MSGIYEVVLESVRDNAEFLMEVVHGAWFIAEIGKPGAPRFFSAREDEGNLILDWYLPEPVPLLRRREFLELLTTIEEAVPQGTIEMGLRTGRLRHRLILKDMGLEDIDHSRFWVRAEEVAERICNLLESILKGPPLSQGDMDQLALAVSTLAGEVEGRPELAKCA